MAYTVVVVPTTGHTWAMLRNFDVVSRVYSSNVVDVDVDVVVICIRKRVRCQDRLQSGSVDQCPTVLDLLTRGDLNRM